MNPEHWELVVELSRFAHEARVTIYGPTDHTKI
jgi:hypothetical protein